MNVDRAARTYGVREAAGGSQNTNQPIRSDKSSDKRKPGGTDNSGSADRSGKDSGNAAQGGGRDRKNGANPPPGGPGKGGGGDDSTDSSSTSTSSRKPLAPIDKFGKDKKEFTDREIRRAKRNQIIFCF